MVLVATHLKLIQSPIDLLRYEANITTEKVAYRLKEAMLKLDFETRVKEGSENMMNAFVKTGDIDPKGQQELEIQLSNSKAKEQLLIKAKNRYAQLHVAQVEETTDALLALGKSIISKPILLQYRYCQETFW